MVALIQSKNHAANKGKTAGKYQFDTHLTRIGLKYDIVFYTDIPIWRGTQNPIIDHVPRH